MKVAIASDHRGVGLKEDIKKVLTARKIEVQDFGPQNEESCDYPDFGFKVAQEVAKGNFDFGILICNSGLGMTIVANKVFGIRATLCINEKFAEYARVHNNANVLVLGAEFVTSDLAEKIISTFLDSKFEGGRHEKRVQKIKNWEDQFIEKQQVENELNYWKKEVRKWQSQAWKR